MPRRVGYSLRLLKSGRWQLLVRGADGAHVGMGSYADKAEAEKAGQAEAVKVRNHTWVDPRLADVQLADYLAGWLERRRRTGRHGDRYSEDAARMLRLHIAPRIGRVALTDLTPSVVSRWYDELVAARIAAGGKVGLVPAKTYRLLHAALEDAVRDQLVHRNPCMIASGGVERSPERPLLDLSTVVDIANAVHPRWRAMILLIGWCGLRPGELASLRRRNVDLLHGRLTVELNTGELSSGKLIEKDPKTLAGSRTIALPAPLVVELEQHLAEHVGAALDARVFTSPRGFVLRRSNFGADFRAVMREAGMPNVRLYDLRHVAGTLAAQLGATERELQARLGHASPAAARRYQHAAERRDRELADRIGATLLSTQGLPPGQLIAHPSRKQAEPG